jgi:hypothetical protein
MDAGIILDIRTAADLNPVDISTYGHVEPDTALVPQSNVSDNIGTGSHKDRIRKTRFLI